MCETFQGMNRGRTNMGNRSSCIENKFERIEGTEDIRKNIRWKMR